MKIVAALFLSALLAVASSVAAGPGRPEAAAESAARSWLAFVDVGNYAKSWTEASTSFRRSVPQPQWQTAAANVRGPLGALKSRTLQSATFTRTMPGAPDGEYVIIQFASSFEQKQSAVETVTPMKDVDGTWRVSGYFIK